VQGKKFDERKQAMLYLGPWGIGVVWLVLIPSFLALFWSFTQFNLFTSPKWVGLENYTELFNDPVFLKSIRNTLSMTLIGVVAGLVMGLGTAVLLQKDTASLRFFRSMIFLPAIVPPVTTGIVWTFILNPNYGLLDIFLKHLGIAPIGWLSDPNFAKYGLLIMVLWGGVGQIMMTFVASLNSLPEEVLEAASLDGAGRIRTFISVILPLMRPILLYNVVIATLFYLQFFEQAFVVSPTDLGAPARSTLTYALYIYQQAFTFLKMGSAAAMSVLLLIVSSTVIGIFFSINKRLEK